jgi:hypothetical protein
LVHEEHSSREQALMGAYLKGLIPFTWPMLVLQRLSEVQSLGQPSLWTRKAKKFAETARQTLTPKIVVNFVLYNSAC